MVVAVSLPCESPGVGRLADSKTGIWRDSRFVAVSKSFVSEKTLNGSAPRLTVTVSLMIDTEALSGTLLRTDIEGFQPHKPGRGDLYEEQDVLPPDYICHVFTNLGDAE